MMKLLMFLGAGIIGFLVAFSLVNRDEIGAQVAENLDKDFVKQCVARAQFPAQLEPFAGQICGCMKSEFDERGLTLTDAFGDKRGEMQRITQSCAQQFM